MVHSERQAQEALELVQQVLETQLQLRLSPEKTRITTYGKGYEFLGFLLSSRSRRMRDKSQQKFKDKVRELTVRCHNLDAEAILKLNRVIRGTAQYFAPEFATNRCLFQKLDSWVRMRLWSMKLKRKNYHDNRKLRVGFFCRNLGLLTLEGASVSVATPLAKSVTSFPVLGQRLWGRPVRAPHAGKYGEQTPLRQRGGAGGSSACLLPACVLTHLLPFCTQPLQG